MTQTELAELSRVLYMPVTLVVLVVAMVLYFYATAFTRVTVEGEHRAGKARRARIAATSTALVGVATLVAHIVVRSMASGRAPLGNMFEFSTVMALTVVVIGLVWQWRA